MSQHKTWESECRSGLRILGDGPVALCVLWNLIDPVVLKLPPGLSQLGVVGNLRTPLGLSWFLRGLWELSHLKKVVIWGSDLTGSGQALLDIWEKGPDSDHKVPGFGWQLDRLIPLSAIDELRRDVDLVDCIGRPSVEGITSELVCLKAGVTREYRIFPPVELPDLQFWPARNSAIHVEASDPGNAWVGALQTVMHSGSLRKTRKDEKIAHVFDFAVSFPVSATEEIHQCFDFSLDDLDRYAPAILSPERPDGVDYGYGERIQNWRGHNQLVEVIERLRESPDTKRATIALLEAPDLSTLEDAPCFTTATFTIIDGCLHGSYVFRSHDMFQGWPLNVYAILRLQRTICNELGCLLGRAMVHSQNAQVYERYWDEAMAKLREFGPLLDRPGEYLRFREDPTGSFAFVITDEKAVRCTYVNPKGDQVLWETEHKSPEALIGWIVESMPWLDHRHILYLGKEQEKLRRSLRTGEEYVQG